MNFPQSIFELARYDIKEFEDEYIEIVPGYEFNQYDNVKKIHLYYNSHYLNGDYEVKNGVKRKKPFYNVSKWRCDVWTKMLDLDTKDFVLVPTESAREWQVWLLGIRLKRWMKKTGFAAVLNEVARYLPIYGSVVLRKTKDSAEIVDLRNLINDPSAKSLESGRYTILRHYMTPTQLRKMKGKWEYVDEVIESYCNYEVKSYENQETDGVRATTPVAEIYEVFTEVPSEWLGKKAGDWVRGRFMLAGVMDYTSDTETKQVLLEKGYIMFSEEVTDENWPFEEVHASKTEGRWQGIGVVEDTMEAQRMKNRHVDLLDKGMELSTLILFQTNSDTIQRNLLADTDTGDIVKMDDVLNRVDTRLYSLADFQTMFSELENLADRQTFSSDILAGDAPPASATATAVVQQLQQASSTFDIKKENIGLFLQRFIQRLVFPSFYKTMPDQEEFPFQGTIDETKELRKRLSEVVAQGVSVELAKKRRYLSEEEYNAIIAETEQKLAQGNRQIWLDIKKNMFKDLEYDVDLIITGENRNLQSQLGNLNFALTLIAKNPAILQNPVLRKILFKIMSLTGISPSELEAAELSSKAPASGPQQTLPVEAASPMGSMNQMAAGPEGELGADGAPTNEAFA